MSSRCERDLLFEWTTTHTCSVQCNGSDRQCACLSCVTHYDVQNIVDDDMLNKLQHIRAKFKVITALLGLRGSLVYSQTEVHEHKNMSF